MISLSAWAYAGRGEQVSEDQIRRWTSGHGSESKHSASWHSGGCFLHIASEKPVEDLVHWGRQLSLICDCDLLPADEIDAVVESAPISTAALLAALYARHGDDFVQHLRGAFAIVLYDHQQEVLKAWTDHFGVKRIVFRDTADGLGIANDLRLLMKLVGRAAEIDQVAVVEYLQYSCIPAPRTIYKGFNRLEPGHQLRGRVRPESRAYWDVTFDDREGGRKSENAQADAVLSEVRRAVKSTLSLPEDSGQIGCFLSGGTDSSSVTALCGELTGKPSRSYSIGFDDPRYNEIEYARIAARSHHCDHHEYFVKPHDILSLARLAGQSYDEPFGNSSIIPAYYCARLAAQDGVTHMLAGDGGDEVFGGNERYVGDVVFQRYDRVPSWFRRVLFEPAVQVTHSMINSDVIDKAQRYLRRASLPLPERLFSYSFLFSTDHGDLFTPEFGQALNGTDPLSAAKRHYWNAPTGNPLNRWLYLDLKITITDNDLRKVTRMADLAGITVRYPLLHPDLVGFAGTIPPGLKVKGTQLRYIFKKGMAPVLPMEIIKKRKHGFGLPYSVWLGEHKELRDFTFDILGSLRCRQRGYFRKDLPEWLWSQYQHVHRIYYGDVIWVFLMLELWHSGQFDSAGGG